MLSEVTLLTNENVALLNQAANHVRDNVSEDTQTVLLALIHILLAFL